MSDDPGMSLRRGIIGKLRKQSAQLSLKRLFDQLTRTGTDQIRQRVCRKSSWIRQGSDGISRHVAYPFLCEN